ncbi:hypothetical protein JXQ70_00835 [bacterium]|nr:hypothetical protein [bacterium]
MVEKTGSNALSSRLGQVLIIIQIVLLLVVLGLLLSLKDGIILSQPGEEAAEVPLSIADMLYTQELYQSAADEYGHVLQAYDLPASKAANIAFKTAELYLRRLGDYPESLAFLMKAEKYDHEGRLSKSINEMKIECLERMKRTSDAQRVLEESALLDQSTADRADASAVVAEIGDKKITVRQFERYLEQLPDEVRQTITNREKKIEFLQQLVATELIHNAAKRKGYERDPAIIDTLHQFEKSIMVQRYISEELSDTIRITPSEVQLFYEAHKADYEGKPFQEVQQQVATDFQQVKYQEALALLFERLSAAEKVTLNPNNINS